MGKEQSKQETPATPDPTPQPQINAAEVDSSSGFHLLEIHTATSVFGAGFTIFAIAMAFLLWCWLKKCRKNRDLHPFGSYPAPFPSSYPLHPMLTGRADQQHQALPFWPTQGSVPPIIVQQPDRARVVYHPRSRRIRPDDVVEDRFEEEEEV